MDALAYIAFRGHQGHQIALTVLVVAACALPWCGWIVEKAAAGFRWVGRCRVTAIGIVFLISLLATAPLALRRGVPLPYVHDEYSYLLAADTFAHGRLTNPTPPAAEHFESMHILVHPTYMSKYPPGQGLAMALGKVLAGHEIWGVWLSTAAAAAAVCWALMAFLPPGWALLGGLMVAVHPQMLEWGQRYWGGSVAVLGGGLLLGGAARILRHSSPAIPQADAQPGATHSLRARDAVCMALGILIVGNTRPFEGFVLTTLLMGGLLVGMLTRHAPPLAVSLRKVVAPAAIVLSLGAIWMGYYNWRITGSAFRLPYQEHQAQYAVVPLFIFQKPNPQPAYSYPQLEQFYVREQGFWYLRHGSWPKLREEAQKNIVRLYEGSLGNVSILAIPLLLLPWLVWKDHTMRLLVLALLLFLAALMTETFMYPHYAAPAAALVAAIDLIALRRLWRLDWRLARPLTRITVAVFALWAAFWWIGFYHWRQDPDEWQMRRHRIATELLAKEPGKHLVIVRYGDHNVHQEWVYNGADLQNDNVIWAREACKRTPTGWQNQPDLEANRRLLDAFKDRKPWLVEPEGNGQPVPYELDSPPINTDGHR